MNIELLFFASLRERLGLASERLVLPADVQTVGALRQHLAARGGPWAAVAQAMATPDTPLHEGAEVAFFPPVTGG